MTKEKTKATITLMHALYPSKARQQDVIGTPWLTLIQTDTPGYQNFVMMPAVLFDLIQEHIQRRIKKEVTFSRSS